VLLEELELDREELELEELELVKEKTLTPA
jgi:hypothetical protein